MAIEDLQSAVASLEQAQAAEQAELGALLSEAQSLHDQLAALQGQVGPAGSVQVSQATLDDLTSRVAALTTQAQTAVTSAQSSDPASGGSPPPAPSPAPAPAPTPAPDAPAAPAAEDRTLYTFDGDPGSVDATVWQQAPFVTSEQPASALYFFSGDTQAGHRNGDGVGGVFHAYDGTPVPTNDAGAPVEAAEGEQQPQEAPQDQGEPQQDQPQTEPAQPTQAEEPGPPLEAGGGTGTSAAPPEA